MSNEDSKVDPSSKNQGEGDYEAARRYRKDVETFAQSADVEKAARDAAPKSKQEARDMQDAEAEGKSHAAGADRRTGSA